MQFQRIHIKNSLIFYYPPMAIKVICLVFFSCITFCQAQFVPSSFKQTVDSLIHAAPETYGEIHSVLQPYKSDTILMRYLSNTTLKENYLPGRTYALNELGRVYRNTSQYTKAIALHKEALEIANSTNNIEFRVASLNDLGVVYRRTSSIRTAMDYNKEALELAESVKEKSKSLKKSINVSLNCIGNLYIMLNQYGQAIEYFKRSMKLESELGNTLGMAINYQNIGECQEHLGELDEALSNYRTSLAYNEEINSDMGRVICKNSIGQIYLKQNRITEASNLLRSTLPLAEKLGDGFLISPIYTNIGWSQMATNNFSGAEENILEGLRIAEKYNLRAEAARANHLLTELYQYMGDYKKALTANMRAYELDEEVANESTVRYVNDIIFKYDSEKKNNQIQRLAQNYEIVQMELRTSRTTLLIGGIALALLAGIFYILYRQYQLKNEKKLLTLEQSMLRSQMNPHFLFNSLNSIKLYIINNEQKNAVHYLNKFSKLVRKILEASSMREIPLAEELETVELYMNIENIRFSNEIDFKVRIDEGVDTHTIKIPSLILQPFLENALWHGLSSKTGKKSIDLHISKDQEQYIHISITDNGVGREAAEKLKLNKILKRKSVGIDITKERLANFSKDFQNSFEVEIVDLYHEDGTSAGTRIILHIPTV
ncbi:tetratricopeptide repeat-containing sensor histidine kinase [Zobellia galactanivorans]|uniref:Two-component system-Sensor histidine kinase n=2 Tax=Zobellia galactanivorans (strain DSM 12802 / CCUG 47099 / CIP 106680 / NCIMB 13871 / Dsij) TaxID=63186 RepID=G0L546_ZOBGA|nr:tetratricopeptide repeat protein [Zobellia galactanivorans]CAZ95946.1 Two-component system-Sensor histidine kinase [Zobellia galactanivorans]